MRIQLLLLMAIIWSCTPTSEVKDDERLPFDTVTSMLQADTNTVIIVDEVSDTAFVFIKDYSEDFIYDMRYATDDNFLHKTVYKCDACLIRKVVVDSLISANKEFMRQGYQIKFFDCYRPLAVQKLMWEIMPNAKYVANPKYGSIHNRGGAVDITIVKLDGTAIDMGTSFDHFGFEAHHNYKKLPINTRDNRLVLKSIMEKHGFFSIPSEWWHYNFGEAKQFPVSDTEAECN